MSNKKSNMFQDKVGLKTINREIESYEKLINESESESDKEMCRRVIGHFKNAAEKLNLKISETE
ncbi:hypothetical protein [Lysinibacillus fusiformis]|uniref:hypothetical protein n=1 Tax=Lysinibacillus fusiformis TaxID=28031 RepID=UPI001141C480|nr:hypothetical protein [Lysinibacillus fusiformis]